MFHDAPGEDFYGFISLVDIQNLPSVFHDAPGEEDFYGFTSLVDIQNLPSVFHDAPEKISMASLD